MFYLAKNVFLFLIFIDSLSLFAFTLSSAQHNQIQKIQAELKDSEYLQLEFKTTRFLPLRKKIVEGAGKAFFKIPTSFLWKNETPTSLVWLFDGTKLYELKQNPKQTIILSGGEEITKIVGFIMDFKVLLDHYEITAMTQKDKKFEFILVPKKKEEIDKVELIYDSTLKIVEFIKLHTSDRYTQYEFFNPNRSKIDAKMFKVEGLP